MIYSLEENNFHYTANGNLIIQDSVWMIASKSYNGWYIVSHGSEDRIRSKYNEMTKVFIGAGLKEEADCLYVFDSTLFGVEEINKCLEITNYIGNLVESDILTKDLIKNIC